MKRRLLRAIIKKHWEEIAPGFYSKNRLLINDEGFYKRNPFILEKPTKKGKALLEDKDGTDVYFRPKTLKDII